MAIRNIRTEEDPVLRKVSRKVENFDEKLFLILDDMKDTLIKSQGIGLAAVQVGILRRMVLVNFRHAFCGKLSRSIPLGEKS